MEQKGEDILLMIISSPVILSSIENSTLSELYGHLLLIL